MKRIGKWFVVNGHRFHFVKVKEGYDVFYKGRVYRIRKNRNTNSSSVGEESNLIKAPMTGKIVSIKVEEGSMVEKDQPLVVIEAMKMEIMLSAPFPSKVRKIHKNEGELVNKDEVIVSLEKDNP